MLDLSILPNVDNVPLWDLKDYPLVHRKSKDKAREAIKNWLPSLLDYVKMSDLHGQGVLTHMVLWFEGMCAAAWINLR